MLDDDLRDVRTVRLRQQGKPWPIKTRVRFVYAHVTGGTLAILGSGVCLCLCLSLCWFEGEAPSTFLSLPRWHQVNNYRCLTISSRMMVETRCHSFEEASPADHHRIPSFPRFRSSSSRESEAIPISESATYFLPFFESPAPQKPNAKPRVFARSKENRISSPERGRYRLRAATSPPSSRSPLRRTLSPDRFIPRRDFVVPKSATFLVTKLPEHLSPQERLFRRLTPGDDPFLPAESSTNSTRVRPASFQWIPRQRPHLITDITNFNSHGSTTQTSNDTIWSVGGASAANGTPHSMTSNGTPNSLSHQSAAPTFVARFMPKKPRYSEHAIHESRLALALDIDQTNRLLGTSLPCPDPPLNPISPNFERLSPFVWKDSAWKKVEREHCEYIRQSLAIFTI